jgi:hypothetical protein
MRIALAKAKFLLQSQMVLFSKSITLMTIDLNKNIMKIEGEVAYCKMEKSKKYLSRISFAENHEKTSIL